MMIRTEARSRALSSPALKLAPGNCRLLVESAVGAARKELLCSRILQYTRQAWTMRSRSDCNRRAQEGSAIGTGSPLARKEKASLTAYVVVSSLAKLARVPQWTGLFSNEAILLNTAFTHHARDTLTRRLISVLPPWLCIRAMDRWFIPGMTQHFAFRKRLCEHRLASALSSGVAPAQIIILGAGFDTLAIRMARQYPAVTFFELDLPQTQRRKVGILADIRHSLPPNCEFVEADLAAVALEEAMRGKASFQAGAITWVVLEGVLMYLTESEVRALFRSLRKLLTGSLTILFGATCTSDAKGNWSLRMINALLAKSLESTKWFCPSNSMPGFLNDLEFRLEEWMPYYKLQSAYRAEAELQNVPKEDENYYVVRKMTREESSAPSRAIKEIPLIPLSPLIPLEAK